MDDLKEQMKDIKNKSFIAVVSCYGDMYSISAAKILNGIMNVEGIY